MHTILAQPIGAQALVTTDAQCLINVKWMTLDHILMITDF